MLIVSWCLQMVQILVVALLLKYLTFQYARE